MDSTICAVSTALGNGAISIIRCSGKEAIKIVNSVFLGSNLETVPSHTIHYGFITYQNEKIDEVLVSIMRAPKTFTMEDIVEINSHGGIAPTNKILEVLLARGCKLAEAGEFTKRAFLNGRIDLLKAEAVGDLIVSETESSRKLAINQITGSLSNKINNIRQKLISLQANIEVNIDYPEYNDVLVITEDILKPTLLNIIEELKHLLVDSKNGRIIKNGIDVAIIGQPNVGKSSILNTLLEENKAIVTNIPGTTRDIVEGKIFLSGIILNIIDTAGLRLTNDQVEKIGVEKSKNISKAADLIIYVIDNTTEKLTYDLKNLQNLGNKPVIVFINKDDKNTKIDINQLKNYQVIFGNTINEFGLNKLKSKIIEIFDLKKIETKDFSYLSSARQVSLVSKALSVINESFINLSIGVSIDLISIDLQNCYELLGEIIGETYKEDLLDELFSKFCLGK